MSRIANACSTGKKIFVPYITAGYPTVADTACIMSILVDAGADIIELGYPFSDPAADGATIQASSLAALQGGFSRDDYFKIIETFRQQNSTTPIVVFSYFNPIFRYGVDRFVARAAACGVDAVLIVDLPFEEQHEIRPLLDAAGLDLIQLVAPTADDKRIRRILETATGFVYQISIRGVTGARSALPTELAMRTNTIKAMTSLPVVVGFGVSSATQIRTLPANADGVVIGSAIISTITRNLPLYNARLAERVRELASAIHDGPQSAPS